jgi:LacI family transcriptional regulator
LLALGRRVPGDVKIIGVDNSPLCNTAAVPLSSVSSRMSRQGATAVDLLASAVAGKKAKSVEIEPLLQERASTAVTAEPPYDRTH